MIKRREIGKRDIFTKNIMKKAQNDVDFIPSIMNYTIFDAQKYFAKGKIKYPPCFSCDKLIPERQRMKIVKFFLLMESRNSTSRFLGACPSGHIVPESFDMKETSFFDDPDKHLKFV